MNISLILIFDVLETRRKHSKQAHQSHQCTFDFLTSKLQHSAYRWPRRRTEGRTEEQTYVRTSGRTVRVTVRRMFSPRSLVMKFI